MKSDNSYNILYSLKDKVPINEILFLRNKLKKTSSSKLEDLIFVELHNPIFVLIMSIFFGGLGVDRFMIGDIGIGCLKLLLGWMTLGVWHIVDIFLCHKKAKEINLYNILNCLDGESDHVFNDLDVVDDEGEEDCYELKEDEKECEACFSVMKTEEIICKNCGYDSKLRDFT